MENNKNSIYDLIWYQWDKLDFYKILSEKYHYKIPLLEKMFKWYNDSSREELYNDFKSGFIWFFEEFLDKKWIMRKNIFYKKISDKRNNKNITKTWEDFKNKFESIIEKNLPNWMTYEEYNSLNIIQRSDASWYIDNTLKLDWNTKKTEKLINDVLK